MIPHGIGALWFVWFISWFTVAALQLPNRRDVLVATGSALVWTDAVGSVIHPSAVQASEGTRSSISLDSKLIVNVAGNPRRNLAIPRIGYSMYKTTADQVTDGVRHALQAGVRHFDVATQYGTNEQVGVALKEYIQSSGSAWGKQRRQNELFVTHKISNAEQASMDEASLQKAVLDQASVLGVRRLDLVMLHSPLVVDPSQRLRSYQALWNLQERGIIGAVGVCHFGVSRLQELVDAGLPPPTVIQLILSPFNQHRDVATWARTHGSILSCSAWSKLSSVQGPEQGWTILGKIAENKGMTKQQVLIRWAIQRGYLCVPRSSSKYKIERQAIVENSWDATKDFILSDEEMSILDGLDERLPAGRLGIIDGWESSDITSETWDPTLV
jgi:2,5-diketo-D-gluconate reductase A